MNVTSRMPIPASNFAVGREDHQSRIQPIRLIVLHHMAGLIEAADARFHNPSSGASAHLGVARDGVRVWLWVDDQNVAYHAGDLRTNVESLGIEVEDAGSDQFTDQQYETVARIVRDKAVQYQVPLTRPYIVGHNEVSDSPTACPGALDIDRVVRGARELVGLDSRSRLL